MDVIHIKHISYNNRTTKKSMIERSLDNLQIFRNEIAHF